MRLAAVFHFSKNINIFPLSFFSGIIYSYVNLITGCVIILWSHTISAVGMIISFIMV